MIPKILEYEDGRVKITPQAFAIPEIKAIIDKYQDSYPERYLTFIHGIAAPDSPYNNVPDEDKVEAVTYDIIATLGEFNYEDPLLEEAIEAMRAKYETPIIAMVRELGNELHRFRKLLKNNVLTFENFKDRRDLMKDIDKIATSYEKLKEQADKELQVATKGDHELGGY